ncbi:MAG: glycosyltransferase family 4 protein [Ruminococcaceae bacterium]|nr:glycosyltransferase family 4 protein [Oscillospiraceae bacterium]
MKNDLTVTFFSNFLLHHQTPFCEAMVKRLGKNFKFVATEKIPQERLDMGYRDLSHETDYAVNSYEDEASYREAMRLGLESDVVIIGDAPDCFVEERLKGNKLTFRYWERFFKEGRWRILDPRVFRARYLHDIRYRKKNLYMLCASAYTAPDCRFIHAYPGKTYRWGYFPPVKTYDSIDGILQSKKKNTILWVARFLKLKHPEAPLSVAKRLRDEGYDFEMNFIGSGVLEGKIRAFIEQNNLSDRVHLLGTMPPEEVRRHMEESEIFLFTSDRNEGWGAVLNESMNSACAVVASGAIGSVPYLIRDGKNGLIYKNGNHKDLYQKVKGLLDHPEKREALGRAAYKTLTEVWNADTAAERFLELAEKIRQGKDSPFADGPCSKD